MGTFANGRVEEFYECDSMSLDQMRDLGTTSESSGQWVARRMRELHEVPLEVMRTVLDQVERQYQGQVLKVEFEHDDGRFIYEMRLLHPNGQLSKLKVDAVDGRVLSVRRKGQD